MSGNKKVDHLIQQYASWSLELEEELRKYNLSIDQEERIKLLANHMLLDVSFIQNDYLPEDC